MSLNLLFFHEHPLSYINFVRYIEYPSTFIAYCFTNLLRSSLIMVSVHSQLGIEANNIRMSYCYK